MLNRRTGLAARYASEATHRLTSSIRRDVAVDTDSPTPVPIATEAAKQAGHLGKSARTAPGTRPSDPGEPIRAACRLANRLFSAAKLEPPLSLAGAAESAPERFPTLRHLRDAFELELLLAGTPPPTDVEGRMAIAAVMAKARQPRGRSAGSARGVQRSTDPHC